MTSETIGFRVCNLFVPEEPAKFEVRTPRGVWEFERNADYASAKTAIEDGKCAITYLAFRECDTSGGRSAALDAAIEESLAISLGASYLTGLTVSPVQDLPMSAVQFLQYGDHYPRPRAMGTGRQMTTCVTDFIAYMEIFIPQYPALEQSEKARLLIHHWLDALAFWSLEDLTLGCATMLEIIAATAGNNSVATGNRRRIFTDRLNFAAQTFNLPPLSADFRDMRNDLVHQGRLSATKFPNKDRVDCAQAIAQALIWIDQYICAAFTLTPPNPPRFATGDFVGANAFSLD